MERPETVENAGASPALLDIYVRINTTVSDAITKHEFFEGHRYRVDAQTAAVLITQYRALAIFRGLKP